MTEFQFESVEGRKVLIVGEVRSGKTKLTALLLSQAIERGHSEEITVLDFAPPRRNLKGIEVGGRIADFLLSVKVRTYLYSDAIRAPRLEGLDAMGVWKHARNNALLTSSFIKRYLSSPTQYLFMNDLTIHLHSGSINLLLEAIEKSRTFVGNAYSGSVLATDHGSGLSRKEGERLQQVRSVADMVIELPSMKVKRSKTMQ